MRWLTLAFLVLLAGCGGGSSAPSDTPTTTQTRTDIYSHRTEPGANGHTLVTVVFPIMVQGDTYMCVVTEDVDVPQIAVSQSCDFSVVR